MKEASCRLSESAITYIRVLNSFVLRMKDLVQKQHADGVKFFLPFFLGGGASNVSGMLYIFSNHPRDDKNKQTKQVGCVPSVAVAVCPGGGSVCPSTCLDMSAQRGEVWVSASVHAWIHPPPVNRMTNRQTQICCGR